MVRVRAGGKSVGVNGNVGLRPSGVMGEDAKVAAVSVTGTVAVGGGDGWSCDGRSGTWESW